VLAPRPRDATPQCPSVTGRDSP